jgi:sortase A
MTRASRWLRRVEITLWVAGIFLLGDALAATLHRLGYQSQQAQAIVRTGRIADPRVLGRIEIPRLGVSAVVREGVDDDTLALAVGHVPGTARPGEHGNTVLAGHRDTFFRPLREIRMSDHVRIVVPAHSYEYRVVSLRVVALDDMRVLAPAAGEELTLVTCYPFRFVGHAPSRFIVRASRVE